MLELEKQPKVRSNRTRKPAAERKIEIVEMAIRLAAEVGPDRLTTEVLARKIGISQAAIFRHFENKGAIWEAVALRLGEIVRENWGKNTIEGDELFAEIRQIVSNHLSTIQRTPALPAILFSRELHADNEKLRLLFVNMVHAFQTRLSALIAADYAKHEIKPAISANDTAFLILSLMQGSALRWTLSNNSFDLVQEGVHLLDIQLNCVLAYNREQAE